MTNCWFKQRQQPEKEPSCTKMLMFIKQTSPQKFQWKNQKSQVVFSRFISNVFLSIYIPVTFKKRNPLTAPSSFLSHFGKCLRFFPPYFKQSRAPSRVNCVWERARRPFAWVLALALAGENWPLTFSRRDPWANLSPSPFVNLVDTRSTRERDQHERDFAERMKLKEMERDFPRQSK